MWANMYLASAIVLCIYFIGVVTFFKIYLPIVIVASSVGTWMFYVQHQYEDAYWERGK